MSLFGLVESVYALQFKLSAPYPKDEYIDFDILDNNEKVGWLRYWDDGSVVADVLKPLCDDLMARLTDLMAGIPAPHANTPIPNPEIDALRDRIARLDDLGELFLHDECA